MKTSSEVNAPRILLGGYLGIISIGTLLLLSPAATRNGISFIDALFTASSSLCVTGLIVKDTALDFTLFGKGVILILIQIGGLGYMTLSTAFFFLLGRKISLRDRLLFRESINIFSYDNLRRFAWRVLRITLVLELIGTLLFLIVFLRYFDPLTAFGHALFHGVSAFCNAGLSSFSENLALFSDSYIVMFTAAFLFISGGLGFIVISDLYNVVIKRSKSALALHTVIVLRASLILTALGTLFIFFHEGHRSLHAYSSLHRLAISFFQAAAPRTAGFNLVSISIFSPVTWTLLMIYMFIGASPGGTGGGIKTTTFVVLMKWFKGLLLGRYGDDITTLKRRIPAEQAFRSFAITALAGITTLAAFFIIMIIDQPPPMKALFEILSALGTVGLSLGSSINHSCSFVFDLSFIGKLTIILVMIVGRIGPLTIGSAMLRRHSIDYKYTTEEVVIG